MSSAVTTKRRAKLDAFLFGHRLPDFDPSTQEMKDLTIFGRCFILFRTSRLWDALLID